MVRSYLSGGANVPSYEGTLAPMCPHMRAHWRHLANMIELVLPLACPSTQPKRQIDQFRCFCTAHSRKSLYFTMGAPFPQNCPFPWGICHWTSMLNMIPWARPSPQPKRHLDWFRHFCTDDYNGTPFPPQNCPCRWGSGPPI